MGHKDKNKIDDAHDAKASHQNVASGKTRAIDSNLAALFESSLPVAQPRHLVASQSLRPSDQHSNIIDGQPESGDDEKTFNQVSKSKEALPDSFSQQAPRKKRKHAAEDDIEGAYMQRLAREQEQDDARRKRAKQGDDSTTTLDGDEDAAAAGSSTDADSALDGDEFVVPQHESLSAGKPVTELDKAGRTVFLGNVSTDCIKSKSSKRQLVEYLASFFAELPESKTKHEVESLRFRSTAYSTSSVPKKAAFAKKELMDATTHSTNAYAVYSTALAAREAVKKLNATIVLGRHLRVDSVAHPAKIDHRRCVFVGNLGFVDDESNIRSAQEDEDKKAPKKGKVAADVEEGLWRTFGAAGLVESVRVVRDKTTRVGKGFAYVQFTDPNSVEKALTYNDKKFPPLLPRKLRVTRAKNITKTTSYSNKDTKGPRPSKDKIFNPKASSQSQSMAGRAGKLLGRAGAAQARKADGPPGIHKSPEDVVFEGHRARSSQGKGTIFGKSKKQGKPTNRSSRRGAAFKASGRKN